MDRERIIRPMQYAGSWYDRNPERLGIELTRAVEQARARVRPAAAAHAGARLAMLPHAGLLYSARGIAALFADMPSVVEQVVVAAPSHYVGIPSDVLTTSDYTHVQTPFGILESLPLNELLPGRVSCIDRRAVSLEHALEMFLPFCALPLMPPGPDRPPFAEAGRSLKVGLCLISRISDEKAVELLGGALLEAVGDESILSGRTVVIASSDFSHYGRRFGDTRFDHLGSRKATAAAVAELDRTYAELFAASRIAELVTRREKEEPTICGFAPGLIVAAVARQLGLTGQVVDQYTSNDIAGDGNEFVSYCSIIWR